MITLHRSQNSTVTPGIHLLGENKTSSSCSPKVKYSTSPSSSGPKSQVHSLLSNFQSRGKSLCTPTNRIFFYPHPAIDGSDGCLIYLVSSMATLEAGWGPWENSCQLASQCRHAIYSMWMRLAVLASIPIRNTCASSAVEGSSLRRACSSKFIIS